MEIGNKNPMEQNHLSIEGYVRNISVKLFWNWEIGLKEVFF